MKIAVASSGLGHVSRGVETWARDLGHALHAAGEDVSLFQGSGEPAAEWQHVIRCSKRFDPATQAWVRRFKRLGGWRYGFGSGYEVEQTTFGLRLWRQIRREYDILHVQDPLIALMLDRLHRARLSRPRVILAHGTEEPVGELQKFSNLQHLAPCYQEEWEAHRPTGQRVFAVPNFVDTETFQPGDRAASRREWDLPEQSPMVLCVAAIKKTHKRVDYLLQEFARLRERRDDAILVVAGAREGETEEVKRLGASLLGNRVRFLEGVSRERIPSLYRAADMFALASLHEMMPIALLEALASGLPVACNDTPTLRWMAGPGGQLTNIRGEGAMAAQMEQVLAARDERSQAARRHAVSTFARPVVLRQILGMYQDVMGAA